MEKQTNNSLTASSLQDIANELLKAQLIYVFPHYIPDGDAMGSCAAVCAAMRKLGKECYIIMEDKYPDNIAFLDRGYCKWVDADEPFLPADLALALDCSDATRFPKRISQFESAAVSASIDHHLTQENYAMFNYVDSDAAATCELIYILLVDIMAFKLDVEQAEAIYTGIVTDTGNFQYSNTTKKTHLITAALYEWGIDAADINIRLHQNERLERIRLHSRVLGELELFCGGLAAMACCTLDLLKETGADDSETDGINVALRNIDGVEVAVFLRERPGNEIKCSLRSKRTINVAEIAMQFGGGGHARASGCSMHVTLDAARQLLLDAITKAVNDAGTALEQ